MRSLRQLAPGLDGLWTLLLSNLILLGCAGLTLWPLWRRVHRVAREDVVANTDYVGPGYGVPAEDTLQAIDLFAKTEAILLDPVYSAKGGAGLIDLCRKGHFKKGERVVFLHTGGAAALGGYDFAFDHAGRWVNI